MLSLLGLYAIPVVVVCYGSLICPSFCGGAVKIA